MRELPFSCMFVTSVETTAEDNTTNMSTLN